MSSREDDSDREKGLYRKYTVVRTDGSSGPGGKHEACEFFVLDLVHDAHAVAALEAYAASCEREYPALYDDLQDKIARLSKSRRCIPLRRRVKGKPGGEGVKCDEPGVIPLGNGCWFCPFHAIEFHTTQHRLGERAVQALERRGFEVPPGRELPDLGEKRK